MFNWLQQVFKPKDQTPVKPKAQPAQPAVEAAPPKQASAAESRAPQARSALSWSQRNDIEAAYTNWLFEGNTSTDLFTNPLETEIIDALDKIVKSNQSGANLVRRMPGVIPQLLQSLRTDDFSGAELARKISHDVVLVGAVLRVANSSFYNPNKSISSIEQAILVLGQAGLRQLITSVAFQPIIDLNSGRFTKLVAPRIWDQSEKCAIANRMIAHEHQVDPFEAFLGGLLQNVGLIVSLRVLDQMDNGKHPVGSESFCNSLIQYGRTLSCSIGKEWHFPAAVTQAIADQGITDRKANLSPMGKCLVTGDYLSKLHMLIKHQRVAPEAEAYRKGLSDDENACVDELNNIKEEEI